MTACEGVRISVIAGDTTVDNRHLWIIRDSAAVEYGQRSSSHERSLDVDATIDRRTTGTIRGVSLPTPPCAHFGLAPTPPH